VAETPEEVKRLLDAIEAFEAIEDPVKRTSAVSEALREWPEFHARLRQIREKSVQTLRDEHKKTWPEIASIIGKVTPERAQQISKGLSGAQRKKNKAEANKVKPAE
jgi:F0F1-type ATP synthase membrane subunit b/b'